LTYENVLVVNQTKLTSTIEAIDDSDIKNDITQILRAALFETGGISIEKFKELIEEKELKYYGNWERATKKPRGNRDFNNQWVNGNGLIINSFYKYRELENELEKIEEYEIKIDEFNKIITELTDTRNNLDIFITQNKKAFEDSSKREFVETKVQNNKDNTKNIKDAEKNWPKIESDLGHQKETDKKLNEKINELNVQKAQAINLESKKYQADKYVKINKLNSDLNECVEARKLLTKVMVDDVKKCNGIIQKITNINITLDAQKLNARISAKSDIAGKITLGADDAKQFSLKGGDSKEEIANGRFIYENDLMKIEVTSGKVNVEEIISKLNIFNKEYDELLKTFKVNNAEELVLLEEKYKAQTDKINNYKSRIEEESGEDTLEQLEKIYKEIQSTGIQRTSNEIGDEVQKLSVEAATLRALIEANKALIGKYEEEFGNRDTLIDKLVDLKTDAGKLETELSGLSPLPEGYSDSGTFIQEYNNSKEEYDNTKDKLAEKINERTTYEKKAPEKTQREVEEELSDAEKEFAKRVEEGEAVLLIKSTIESTLASFGKDTYKPLQDTVMKYLKASMNADDCDIKLEELSAKSLTRGNKEIPVGLLSTGTKDLIGLILRLSMAEFYLKDSKGFLIMDDPLVNLDPQRQEKAVELIKEFSKEKQILIMTCHPRHAELFKENIVNLY
jgi:exonuclease SbcC